MTRRSSEICRNNDTIADSLPSQCENQPILQVDALEAFEKKNAFSMFSHSYPTSWWTQFATLVNRNVRVILRDPRLSDHH